MVAADKAQSDKGCVPPLSEDCGLRLVLLTSMTVEVQLRVSFCIKIFIRIHWDVEQMRPKFRYLEPSASSVVGNTNVLFCRMMGGYFPVSRSRLSLHMSAGRASVVAWVTGGSGPCSRPELLSRREPISGKAAAASCRSQQYMKPPSRSVISQSTQDISAHLLGQTSRGATLS